MAIPTTQLLGPYTNRIAAIYKEKVDAPNFLRSYFPSQVELTRFVSVWVQRGYERIAVDCSRGAMGQRHQWSKSTEKVLDPLYYRLNFDLTAQQHYDVLWNPSVSNASQLAVLLNSIAENSMELRTMIERAIEVMCAQIFANGVIEMSNEGTGISIDFKRRAASIIDSSGANPWTTGTVDPFAQIAADCDQIRQQGKSPSMEFDVICGHEALAALKANAIFIDRQKTFNMKLDSVAPARATSSIGATWHGKIEAESYICDLYSYRQTYDVVNADGTFTPTSYIDPKSIIVVPKNPYFKTFFGAVPMVTQPGQPPMAGDFVMTDWIAQDRRSHTYEVESCPLPVPVAVDQIVTRKVKA